MIEGLGRWKDRGLYERDEKKAEAFRWMKVQGMRKG